MRSCASAVLSAAFSLSLGVLLVQPLPVRAVTSYANDFVDPTYVLAKDFSNVTAEAQATIVSWAQSLAREGPWSECTILHQAYRELTRCSRHEQVCHPSFWRQA